MGRNEDQNDTTVWLRLATILCACVLATVFVGSTVTALAAAHQAGVGWILWHYPLLAILPVVMCFLASGLANFGFDKSFDRLVSRQLMTSFAKIVRFFLLTVIFFALVGDRIFSMAIANVSAVDAEAESLFFHSWQDLPLQIVLGSCLIAIAVGAVAIRPRIRYWLPIGVVTAAFGLLDLGHAVVELASFEFY